MKEKKEPSEILELHWARTHQAQKRAFEKKDLIETKACAWAIRAAHHYRKAMASRNSMPMLGVNPIEGGFLRKRCVSGNVIRRQGGALLWRN